MAIKVFGNEMKLCNDTVFLAMTYFLILCFWVYVSLGRSIEKNFQSACLP